MQTWLTVIGLVLDIVGVLLISAEWYIANYAPADIFDAYRRGYADGYAKGGTNLSHDELKKRAGSDEQISRGLRSSVVLYAIGLAVLGFVFQLIGAWPI